MPQRMYGRRRTAGTNWCKDESCQNEGLYRIDDASQIKRSNDNPIVGELYEGLLKGKEHKLLHNNSDLPQAK